MIPVPLLHPNKMFLFSIFYNESENDDVAAYLECWSCWADNKEHAIEQWQDCFSEYTTDSISRVMVEIE